MEIKKMEDLRRGRDRQKKKKRKERETDKQISVPVGRETWL